MTLLTLFSAPKSFADLHIATIQRNAIKSWTTLPDVDVVLMGEEDGLAETSRELGVRHMPNVARSGSGAPLISSMFRLVRENSSSELLCIVNADMILMPDFVEAARTIYYGGRVAEGVSRQQCNKFVLLSQRWDLDVTNPLFFSNGWEKRLREDVQKRGQLHRPAGSDFFLFPKPCYTGIPDFTIGRAGWDNWMIYHARQEKWPVIDCTPSVMIVHQNHDYRHLPESKPHYEHPETNKNIRLAGGPAAVRYTILDATHRLKDGKLVHPAFTGPYFWRKVELFLRKIFFFLPENVVENVARPKRWKKRLQKIFGKWNS